MDMKKVLEEATDWAERNGCDLAEQLAESYNCQEVDLSPDGVAIACADGPWHWLDDHELIVRLAQIGYGVTAENIEAAATAAELDALVERAAVEHMRELYRCESYRESADRLAADDDVPELVTLLRAAEVRWFELGVPRANTVPEDMVPQPVVTYQSLDRPGQGIVLCDACARNADGVHCRLGPVQHGRRLGICNICQRAMGCSDA